MANTARSAQKGLQRYFFLGGEVGVSELSEYSEYSE